MFRRVAVTSRGPAQGADSARAASGVGTAAGLLQLLERPRPGFSGSSPGPRPPAPRGESLPGSLGVVKPEGSRVGETRGKVAAEEASAQEET